MTDHRPKEDQTLSRELRECFSKFDPLVSLRGTAEDAAAATQASALLARAAHAIEHLESQLVQTLTLRDQWCAEYTKLRDIVRDAAKWHTDRLPPPGPYHPSLAALIQAAKNSQ